MQWLKVVLAGLVEVIWITILSNANSLLSWIITILLLILSFYLVLSATKQLPVGTVYAIFVGIGTAGTVIVDMLWFDQSFTLSKIILLILLLIGIVGLQLTSNKDEGGQQ